MSLDADETAPFVQLGDDDDSLVFDEHVDTDELRLAFEPRDGRVTRCCNKHGLSSQRSIALVILIVSLVVALVVCVVFLVKSHDGKGKCASHKAEKRPCLTQRCIELSAEVMSNMNLSADPCEDFHEYACGGWDSKNDIPDTQSYWGQFQILKLKNDNFLKKSIKDPDTKRAFKDNEAVQKAFKYYEACMKGDAINERGAKPLQDLIEQYGSWNISGTGSWNASNFDLTTALIKQHKSIASLPPLFYVFVSPDYKNSSHNLIKLDQAGLVLSRDVYLNDNQTVYDKTRKAYKKLMIDTVALLGGKGADAERQLMEVYDFEKQLATITMTAVKRQNIGANYKRLTVQQFQNYVGDFINWQNYLQGIFKEHGATITNETIIATHALDYLRNMSDILRNTSKNTLNNYMVWHIVNSFLGTLSDDFKKVLQDFIQVKDGTSQEQPKWQECLMATSQPFGMPLGLLFVEKKFTSKSKLMVQELIREIRDIFIKNLGNVEWMDSATKKAAEEKARGVLENIGYPEQLKNRTALEADYKGLNITDQYFENVVAKSRFVVQKNLANINEPVDSSKWVMSPQVVNAYYTFSKNKIVFPAGILQNPFYDKDRPRSLNYGGIGAVVGHEITHGFDDNGRRFNKEGNLRKWWTNHSIEAFTEKAKCLIDQYSKFEFFGNYVNGKQTLSENIADNGGVKQAYQAYQRYVAKHGEEHLLPGLNSTNDQLFFLGFGQVWCGKYRRQSALNQLATGSHTPGRYRVIGTLMNSEGFAKAYNCPKGARMNPETKCQVW